MGISTGVGTVIYNAHQSNIQDGAQFGTHCRIHSHVWIGGRVVVGDRCKIQAFAFLPDGVTLEDNVFIGPHVCFTNDPHPPSQGKRWLPTIVKNGAVIGANATILPGITIGEYAVIGAGAVVTEDVPAGETWVGNPARSVKG